MEHVRVMSIQTQRRLSADRGWFVVRPGEASQGRRLVSINLTNRSLGLARDLVIISWHRNLAFATFPLLLVRPVRLFFVRLSTAFLDIFCGTCPDGARQSSGGGVGLREGGLSGGRLLQ